MRIAYLIKWEGLSRHYHQEVKDEKRKEIY